MTAKATIVEFTEFWNDKEYFVESGDSDGYTYIDDETIEVDGIEIDPCDFSPSDFQPSAIITFGGGTVFGPVVGKSEPSLDVYFKRWQKAQKTRFLVCRVDVCMVKEFKKMAREIGVTFSL